MDHRLERAGPVGERGGSLEPVVHTSARGAHVACERETRARESHAVVLAWFGWPCPQCVRMHAMCYIGEGPAAVQPQRASQFEIDGREDKILAPPRTCRRPTEATRQYPKARVGKLYVGPPPHTLWGRGRQMAATPLSDRAHALPRPLTAFAFVSRRGVVGAAAVVPARSLVRRVCVRLPIRCLLYTSPSPRDRQKSRMPSSA